MRANLLIATVLVVFTGCGDDGGGGGGGGDDAAVTDGTGTGTDAGVDAPPGSTADASIGPLCITETCGSGEACCTGSTVSCVTIGQCPTQSFECDGAEDCAGGVCCFGNQGAGGSLCRAAGTNCGELACHGDAECPTAEPKCCPKTFTPSYKV
jgi:hypothetical protein